MIVTKNDTKDGVDGCRSIHLLHFYIFTPFSENRHAWRYVNTASRMTPKMTAMKDSVLNQSKNFAQNNRVGQSIQRTFTPNHQVTHTKDSMVKSEGKHVSNENKSLIKLYLDMVKLKFLLN